MEEADARRETKQRGKADLDDILQDVTRIFRD
jgi:hypothetical protein